MVVAVSQPSVSLLLLQSPNPDAHAPVHTPAAQVRVAMFVPEHTLAVHAPQWSGSVCRFTSQPFVRSPSQFAKPAVQVIPQTLAAQAAVPFVPLHAAAQVPQLEALVVVFVSQPFATLLSQFPYPTLHAIPHFPPVQLAVPLLVLHAAEQAPQFVALVLVFVSQPFATLLSQFPYPALHAIPHCPPLQLAVPFVPLQAVLQAPQFVALVLVLISQPLAALLSQFSNPTLHAIPHCPPLQLAVPFVLLHGVAQVPQFAAFVFVFVSQPLPRMPSQFPNPALHTIPHCPPLHVAVPLVVLHAVAQLPHFAAFVFVFVSQPFATAPSQFPYPTAHVIPQAPLVQVAVPFVLLHVVAHVPQRLGVVCRLTSQPLTGSLSQFPYPVAQVIPQTPAVQVAVPLVALHPVAQVPQFAVFVLVFVSQPFAAFPSQFAKPAAQVIPQTPAVQVAVPLVALHTLPQPPQLPTLVFVFVSQPLVVPLSQSPKPEAQALQAPVTQVVAPPHAVPACQAPFAPQVCGSSPVHCFAPGTHTPPQTPAAHTYEHAVAFSHTPPALQVCGTAPLHCFASGVQAPAQVPAVHTNEQAVALSHRPAELHVCGT